MMPFYTGLLEGILISILLFGPAFFKLVNVSMKEGLFKGWWLATGVLISDLLVVLLFALGFSDLMQHPLFQKFYSIIAGIAMIFIGVKYIRHRYKAFLKSYSERNIKGQSLLSGLLLNLINPFTFILWFNVVSTLGLKYENDEFFRQSLILNAAGILCTIYLMDMLKVYLANILGKQISHRMFYILNRYFGVVFILIGAVFIIQFIKLMI
jgi:threonine/homoserine/homoserine lactone efflux protein